MGEVAGVEPEAEAAGPTGGIIDRFGGIRPMATKLAVPVTTVQGWKKRGIIPQVRHADILAAAARENIAIDPAELAATDPNPAAPKPEARPTADPIPEPMPQPVSPQPVMSKPVIVRKNGSVAYIALIVALAVGLAGAAAAYVGWRYYLQPLQARVAALEARPGAGNTDDLARRVARLESQAGRPALSASAAAEAPAANASDNNRLAALEKQLAELKAGAAQSEQLAKGLSELQLAAGGRELLAQSIRDIQSSMAAAQGAVERLNGQVGSLSGRLDKIDAVLANRHQQALRAEATILSVGQLRAALATSKPFAKQLAAVRAMVANDAEINGVLDQMQPYADSGVETSDDLTRDFSRLAPNLVRTAIVGDGNSWWRQALYHIESVVSIRRTGADVQGDSTGAVVARAEAKLDEDDLPGAIAMLQGLSGAAADLASPWIHDAQHRVAVDTAESDLSRIAISRVSTGTPTGATAAPQGPSTPAPSPPPAATPSPAPADAK